MGKDSAYYKEKYRKQREMLDKLLTQLPDPAKELVEYKLQDSALSTLQSYCYDLRMFFTYYLARDDTKETSISEIDYDVLNSISPKIIESYQKQLEFTKDGELRMLKKSVARKMSPIRSMYDFHYQRQNITNNPTRLVYLPRAAKDKAIVRMNSREVKALLKAVSTQSCFKRPRQKSYKKKTKQRDMAIFSLLLNTGIRLSECIGLDLDDVDFRECSIAIVRKGGGLDIVYFNKDVKKLLKRYIKGERAMIEVNKDSSDAEALFLSIQGRRMTPDAVERMVRSYTSRVIPNKHITPHKLRSTYGTALYRETHDIRLVAEVLGHENINTTIRYYAAFDDDRKKKAAELINMTRKEDVDAIDDSEDDITMKGIEKAEAITVEQEEYNSIIKDVISFTDRAAKMKNSKK